MIEIKKEQVYQMLLGHKVVLSKGDFNFGVAKLPKFKIILEKDTPINQ